MKRIICLITTLCIVLGSFSFIFATDISWNTNDSGHLTEIRNSLMSGGTIYNLINSCKIQLNNINSNLLTLMGWLDPSAGGSTTALLNQILSMISYTDTGGAIKSWLSDIWQKNSLTQDNTYAITPNGLGQRSMTWLTNNNGNWVVTSVNTDFYTALTGNLNNLIYVETQNHNLTWPIISTNYNSVQSPRNWLDLTLGSFTPVSITDGIYNWFNSIQQPVARLSYILASDQRIAAQQAAASNEQAVVNNFVDSNGSGSISVSDIGSMSNASGSVKTNFNTGYSSSNVWDIFNSEHYGWFSQECADSLDTTSSNTRSLKSSSKYDTPLLDLYYEQILSLGGDN